MIWGLKDLRTWGCEWESKDLASGKIMRKKTEMRGNESSLTIFLAVIFQSGEKGVGSSYHHSIINVLSWEINK